MEEWEWLHVNDNSETRFDDPNAHIHPLVFTVRTLAAEYKRNQPLWPGAMLEQPMRGMALIREWEESVWVCEKEQIRRKGGM